MTSRSGSSRRPGLALGLSLSLVAALLPACADEPGGDAPLPIDDALSGLALDELWPQALVPGTRVVLRGRSFVAEPWATAELVLSGTSEHRVPLTFVDFDRLEFTVDAGFIAALGPESVFEGDARVAFHSAVDEREHTSNALPVTLSAHTQLTPTLDGVQEGGLIFVNDAIAVHGQGMLLGGDEGETVAVVTGCFQPADADACAPLPDEGVAVVVTPDTPDDRTRGSFRFSPHIAGIMPGAFSGAVALQNRHGAGYGGSAEITDSQPRAAAYELIEPMLFGAAPTTASLGQYIDIQGGGFVDASEGGQTLISLVGTFTPDGGEPLPLDVLLVPELALGPVARYVVAEDDALGQVIDLRRQPGTITGVAAPQVRFGEQLAVGAEIPVQLGVAPVTQVVHVAFLPSYVESLRHFGLRAADQAIRARALAVLETAYEGVGVTLREAPPDDFALYSQVDIAGPDPNGLGLLGYDNSPGKDTGNQRLYDRIGSVNALTQEDGFPGYGGVFVESMFAFSEHPPPSLLPQDIDTSQVQTPLFDAIFDPFRPDRGGAPLTAADFEHPLPTIEDPTQCPAPEDRALQIACAIHAFGSLVGTTTAHELGHALGLADPNGVAFHNLTGTPGRIMNAASDRSFAERAEIAGEGPSRFCAEHHAYLQMILPPQGDVAPDTPRPSCL